MRYIFYFFDGFWDVFKVRDFSKTFSWIGDWGHRFAVPCRAVRRSGRWLDERCASTAQPETVGSWWSIVYWIRNFKSIVNTRLRMTTNRKITNCSFGVVVSKLSVLWIMLCAWLRAFPYRLKDSNVPRKSSVHSSSVVFGDGFGLIYEKNKSKNFQKAI